MEVCWDNIIYISHLQVFLFESKHLARPEKNYNNCYVNF